MKTFEVYEEMGSINTATHETIGYSTDYIKKFVSLLNSPKFAYCRQKNYGIAIYHKDDNSPTGVINVGGLPTELEPLMYAITNKWQLSPTEDLRTAH